MNIYLDNLIFSLQSVGGISVYWKSFLKNINNSNCKVSLINRGAKNNLCINEIEWKKNIISDSQLPISLLRILPLLKILPKYSLFHSSYFRISLQRNVCNIVTLHDLAAELNMVSGWKKSLKIKLQANAINKADGIICVSKSTQKALLTIYPQIDIDQTTVIYHGCSDSFHQIQNIEKKHKQVLFIGGRKDYKNFETCLNVLSLLLDYELIIIGGDELSHIEILEIEKKIQKRYKYLRNIETSELNILYNQSQCLFYPSYYEGFGMPVIEAMKAGCVVVSSVTKAIVEVSYNAAILIENPKDVESFKKAILKLEDDSYREKWVNKGLIIAKKYNWKDNFEQTLSFYQKIYYQKFSS